MAMVTDPPPRNQNLKSFDASDRLELVSLPSDGQLAKIAAMIDTAMRTGKIGAVHRGCQEFLGAACDFYRVPSCSIRVLAARPLRVREHSTTELFGDYHSDTKVIRVWMRTAIRKDITSFGTFLSTLCHEICHHLDFHKFRFRDSWHTRGFYQRAAMLYHHSRGTPVKQLVWAPLPRRRWRIDWPQTIRGSAAASISTALNSDRKVT